MERKQWMRESSGLQPEELGLAPAPPRQTSRLVSCRRGMQTPGSQALLAPVLCTCEITVPFTVFQVIETNERSNILRNETTQKSTNRQVDNENVLTMELYQL